MKPDPENELAVTRASKPLPQRLAWSAARVVLMLMLILVTGCFIISQPTMHRNEPSSKTADPAVLRKHVVALSETFHPRDWENPGNLNRCADYIAGHLRQAGAEVEFQDFEVEGNTYRNVIGRFGAGKERKIIIGAHYDSCGEPLARMTMRAAWPD